MPIPANMLWNEWRLFEDFKIRLFSSFTTETLPTNISGYIFKRINQELDVDKNKKESACMKTM
jgi:hypothetical protein